MTKNEILANYGINDMRALCHRAGISVKQGVDGLYYWQNQSMSAEGLLAAGNFGSGFKKENQAYLDAFQRESVFENYTLEDVRNA